MDILELLKEYKYTIVNDKNGFEIKDIEIDSRNAKANVAFFCIIGETVDGHDYVNDCYDKGVRIFITSKDVMLPNDTTIIKVENSKNCFAFVCNSFFKEPSKKLNLVGITGTNGKTSTTSFIENIIMYANKSVGSIGTLGIRINNIDVNYEFTTSTTPDCYDLQRIFKKFTEDKVENCVMEVSSHGLQLDRVSYSDFNIGVFTNLTQDHLDFHKTMENYFNAKKILMNMSKYCIINIDDTYGERLYEEYSEKSLSISIDKESDFKAYNIKYNINSVEFDLNINDEIHTFKVGVPGKFTVYNALTSIITCIKLNIDINTIKKALLNISVAGRMQPVENTKKLNVFVDYAHTPDALESVIKCAKENTKGKVITLFGCGGDRDKTKRPIMGEIAKRLSDIAVVTSDNPRTEDAKSIIEDILNGILDKENVYTLIDRKEAIKKAISIATPNDSVIIAGKGHEDYQIIGNTKYDFDDYLIAKEIMEGLDEATNS